MDTRIGGFLQRTFVKTFGSPQVVTKLQKHPAKSPVITDSAQFTRYGPVSVDYGNTHDSRSEDTQQSVDDLGEIDTVESIRIDACLESSEDVDVNEEEVQLCLPASEHESAREGTICMEKDNRNKTFTFAKTKESQQEPPYADGETRIIMADDGAKECMAMLVTEAMVFDIRTVRRDKQALAKKRDAFDAATIDALEIECDIEKEEERIESTEQSEEAGLIGLKVQELRLELRKAEDRRDMLREEMESLEICLTMSRESAELTFEKVLEESALLDPAEPEFRPTAGSDFNAGRPENDSTTPSHGESIPPGPDELLRLAALNDLDASWSALMQAQANFDDRQADSARELANYYHLIAEGKISYTRTDFDCGEIQHVQMLSRKLKRAEEWYRNAKEYAKTFRLPDGEHRDTNDTDSNDSQDDGSQISQELRSGSHVNRERIEAWWEGVCCARPPSEHSEPPQVDEDARTVGMMDSVSVVDYQGYAEEIHDWQEHCRALREKLPSKLGPTLWTGEVGLLKRRISC
ncbi:hypothetical protein MMC28_002622 [Mycoblastus sanguinarius]|nr:hypothetical protein [Mycoblastus sanguinarius]